MGIYFRNGVKTKAGSFTHRLNATWFWFMYNKTSNKFWDCDALLAKNLEMVLINAVKVSESP